MKTTGRENLGACPPPRLARSFFPAVLEPEMQDPEYARLVPDLRVLDLVFNVEELGFQDLGIRMQGSVRSKVRQFSIVHLWKVSIVQWPSDPYTARVAKALTEMHSHDHPETICITTYQQFS